jgi:hypothetical protein
MFQCNITKGYTNIAFLKNSIIMGYKYLQVFFFISVFQVKDAGNINENIKWQPG